MPDETRVAKTILRYEVENAKALQGMADVERRLQNLGDKALILTRTNQAWARSLAMDGDTIRASMEKAEGQVTRLSQRLAAAKSQAAGNYNALRDELMGGGDSGGTTTTSTAGGGKFNIESLRRTGGALSQLGLGVIGEPVSRLGDVAEVAKTASTGLEAVGLSLGGVVAVAAPVAAGLAGVALILKLVGDDAQAAANKLKQENAAGIAFWSDQDRARKEALTASSADVDKTAQSLGQAIADANNRLTYMIAANQSRIDQAAPWQKGAVTAQAQQDIEGYIAEINKLQREYNYQTNLLGPMVKQHEALNAQIEAETKAIQARIAAAETGVSRDIEQAKLLRTATPDQVKDLVADRQDEIRAIKDQMQGLEDVKGKSKEAQAEYDKLAERLATAQNWLQWYNDTLRDQADKNKVAADAAKKLADAEKARQDYYDKQPDAIADAVRKSNTDIKAIEEQGAKDRAAILKRANDAIVEAARKAAEGAEDALRKLGQQRDDLLTGLDRDMSKIDREAATKEIDIRINAQREEAQALRAHYVELAKIRQDAQDREYDLILNRDFLALFQSRRQTNIDLRNANQQFGTQESERAIGEQNQVDDLRRSLAQQRAERIIAYNQQLQDAQIAYQRELQTQQIAESRSIAQAVAARIADLNAQGQAERAALANRRQQAISEIGYAKMTYEARIKFLTAERDTLIAQANAMQQQTYGWSMGTRNGRTAPTRTAAGGAALDAGAWTVVHGGESFNGATFPGLGLFYPVQGGAVTNQMQANYNISGNNPEAIWHYIEPRIAQTVERLIH